jgi:multicomponent Na+:H+ antiporter subunit A
VPHAVRSRFEVDPFRRYWDWPKVIIAGAFGLSSAWVSWLAIRNQPAGAVALWYNEQANTLTGAKDVVAAILVHFRALDTLGEIVVFAITTLGVLVIIQQMRKEQP